MGIEKEIIIEIERVRVTCQRTRRYNAWCAECGANSDFINQLEMAALSGHSLDRIAELTSIGIIHNLVTSPKTFLVCLNSLLNMGDKPHEIKIIQPIKDK